MMRLQTLPRVICVAEPTPLVRAARLSSLLDVEVWLKRDDLTGLGLGGNKARVLEYLLADAKSSGCDCIVTGAGTGSNWAMLAATAARRAGLDAEIVYYGTPVPATGNHQLAELVGASISFTNDERRESVDQAIAVRASQCRAAGRVPYVIPRGGATPTGALGYVRGGLELCRQLESIAVAPRSIWLATGSCGTQAGLLAAMRAFMPSCRVVGVTVSRPAEECRRIVSRLAIDAALLADLPAGPVGTDPDVCIIDGFIGPGYGKPSPASHQAARTAAENEGLFLDPVFGAKAMAALLAAVRQQAARGPVIFLVTGGAPNLFSVAEGAAL